MAENQDSDDRRIPSEGHRNPTNGGTIGDLQDLGAAIRRMAESMEPFVRAMQQVSQAFAPVLEAIGPYIRHFHRYSRFVAAVSETGWLPYHTLSIDQVEDCRGDAALLDTRIADFYANDWQDIRDDIEARLDLYAISVESRKTLRESFSAHEAGLYRCVCSVLFPTIEREFRICFFEDRPGRITSKKMLEKLNRQASVDDIRPREAYGWILFDRLADHLYVDVNRINRSQFEADDVPNRHASLHGHVPYNTFKHSMNMIIMADYVFQVLTSISESKSSEN